MMEIPEGKFASTVRVGEKGQIVIPKAAREMFNIKPGDTLLLLADVQRGIAIVRQELFAEFTDSVLQGIGSAEPPVE
jgi:AbrB family looped-hinge helix DNA binding protein